MTPLLQAGGPGAAVAAGGPGATLNVAGAVAAAAKAAAACMAAPACAQVLADDELNVLPDVSTATLVCLQAVNAMSAAAASAAPPQAPPPLPAPQPPLTVALPPPVLPAPAGARLVDGVQVIDRGTDSPQCELVEGEPGAAPPRESADEARRAKIHAQGNQARPPVALKEP